MFSSICFALAIASLISIYAYYYRLGALEFTDYLVLFDPISEVIVQAVLFLLLVVTLIVSLFLRRDRLWTLALLLGYLLVIAFTIFVLPPPGVLIIHGLQDHVMRVSTLDDLRQFARDVNQKMPGINIPQNDMSGLIAQTGDDDSLSQKYPYLKWGVGGKGNPSIYEKDGALSLEWGGSLVGHWGFSIALDGKRIEADPDREFNILRMSDDIYFFDEE